MPPKPKKTEPSKKTEAKKKEKVIEDKTFGLKNKKGTKQQKFIQTVTQQVQHGNQKASKMKELEQQQSVKKKEEKKKETDELNMLFRPVQTISKGADPKSVVCAFFKQGQCKKGDKCKFSHDLNLNRKGEKRSMYADGKEEDETMENWDETKLEDVVNKKHAEDNKSKQQTDIICRYFLEAVENSKYGWFWECPNGVKCIYKHALPPGFVLKKDQKKEDVIDKISLEELVEKERAALGFNTTRVTLESFLKWKQKKKNEKAETKKAISKKKKDDFKAGKMLGISGRELFEFNPDLVEQDDEEVGEGLIEREEEEEEEGTIYEIDMEDISSTTENSQPATIAASNGLGRESRTAEPTMNGENEEDGKLEMAAALLPNNNKENDAEIAASLHATLNGDAAIDIPIDEDLFGGEDLDQVEEDLETLDLDEDL